MATRGRPLIVTLGLALLSLQACGGITDAFSQGEPIASVDNEAFSVSAAAEILAPFDGFENSVESVRSLADLWIDYTVLADAMNADSTLGQVDLTPVRELQARQQQVLEVRDSLVQVDTALTEEEVRRRWEVDDSDTEIHARHILIVPPVGATLEQRDSVRAFTRELRSRIEGGESFEQIAVTYSVDISAEDGGDLGFFGHGQTVPAFEEAAFALQPGELSDVVETQFGFHIIRVDERRRPPFEDVRDQYRTQIQQEMRSEAESGYITQLDDSLNIRVTAAGLTTLSALIANPWQPLSGASARSPMVEWDGGAVTAGDVRDYLVSQPREVSVQLRTSDSDAREDLLLNFARQDVLVAEADRLGIEAPLGEWELTESLVRRQASSNAHTLGIFSIEPAPDEDRRTAAQRAVRQALSGNLSGDIALVALGAAIGPVRASHRIRMYPEAFQAVVDRVAEIRSEPGFEPFQREQPGAVQPAPNEAAGDSSAAGTPGTTPDDSAAADPGASTPTN